MFRLLLIGAGLWAGATLWKRQQHGALSGPTRRLFTVSPKGKRGKLTVGRGSVKSIADWYRRHGYTVTVR